MNKNNIALKIVIAIIAIFSVTGTAYAYTIGQTGQDIVDLQITLIEAGFDIPAITSGIARPGYFGPQTQKALTAYNARQGSPVFGAVSTLDGVDNPFFRVNDLREYFWSRPFTATSSVICSLFNPYNGTSTIVAFTGESRANNSVSVAATNLYVSTSTSVYGTSTPALLSAFSMGTGQWSFGSQINTASTSVDTNLLPGKTAQGASNYTLGPGQYLNWRIGTTTPGTFSNYMAGSCSAILLKN